MRKTQCWIKAVDNVVSGKLRHRNGYGIRVEKVLQDVGNKQVGAGVRHGKLSYRVAEI